MRIRITYKINFYSDVIRIAVKGELNYSWLTYVVKYYVEFKHFAVAGSMHTSQSNGSGECSLSFTLNMMIMLYHKRKIMY